MTIYYLICFLLLFSKFNIYAGQDNIITFIPSTPLCIGKEVQMICFVVSNTSENFIDFTALISFDGSVPATPNTINKNGVVGVNTTRYTADTVGLNISTDRPGVRLTISDYQATDGDIVFGCHGAYSGFVPSAVLVSDSPQRLAVPPSSPPVTLSESNNNCSNIVISWTTPDSDRDITEYSVYRNNTLLITTTDNNYTDTNQLTINTVYEYSVTAISCAGDSTPGVTRVSIRGYSINNSTQLFLSYDNTTSILTIDWTLLPVTTPPPLMLEYSLDLVYNHTQSNITHQFSNSTTFLLLSSITELSTYITPHNFTTDDGVVTNTTACIQIIRQCGVFNGQTLCGFFNSENPPTTSPTTSPTNPTTPTTATTPINTTVLPTTTEEPILLPIIIGVVGGIGGILLMLFIVLFFIMLYICCIRKNRGQSSPKRSTQDDHVVLAVTPSSDTHPDTQPTYAQVDKAKSLKTAELYSSVNKPKPAPQSELMYLELDHMRTASDRINPSSIPTTNYSDLAQLPRSEQTTYATVTDGPLH